MHDLEMDPSLDTPREREKIAEALKCADDMERYYKEYFCGQEEHV